MVLSITDDVASQYTVSELMNIVVVVVVTLFLWLFFWHGRASVRDRLGGRVMVEESDEILLAARRGLTMSLPVDQVLGPIGAEPQG